MGCWDRLVLILFVAVTVHGGGQVLAVNGIYVNNQKIDKFEADRIKLLHPGEPSPDTHPLGTLTYAGNGELLTKENFTNVQHYYQYLVGGGPVSYIDLLWGKNKTHFPSLFRVSAPDAAVQLDDEQSSIKNTLNNTDPIYVGDYHRDQLPPELPVILPTTSTRAPTKSQPNKRFKKRPKPTKTSIAASLRPVNKTELTPETLALLTRYYSFSCTLVPKQRSQPPSTTTAPPTTTRKVKTRRLTTEQPPARHTTPSSAGKRKKATVYVDPPVINRIGGMLESVYNFMENALTSTEYVTDPKQSLKTTVAATNKKNHRSSGGTKVKRNARNITTAISDILARIGDTSSGEEQEVTQPWSDNTSASSTTSDSSPESSKRFTPDRVTISGMPVVVSDANKNKMTTNIQVTSEYTAATPPTVPLGQQGYSDENDSSEEESEEDYFGGFGGYDDDDEEEDDDDEDDDVAGGQGRPGGQGVVNDKVYDDGDDEEDVIQTGTKGGKRRRRKKRPADSYDESEYSDEDDGSDENGSYDDRDEDNGANDADDDDDDDYDSDEVPSDSAEGFFGGLFSSFGRFVRSLGFGGAARGTPEMYGDYDEGGARSTTPRILDTRRRPTRSTSYGVERPATQIERDPHVTSSIDRSPWLDLPPAYLFNEIHDEEDVEVPVLEAPVPPTPEIIANGDDTSSGWFDLMMPWNFFNPWAHDEPEGLVQEEASNSPTSATVAALQEPELETPTNAPPTESSWLSHIFGGAPVTTTTKVPPRKTTPRPEQLLSALAQYLVQATPSVRPPTKSKRRKSYIGYQLWRVSVENDEQLQRLGELQRSPEGRQLQWWSGPSMYEPTDVLVPPGSVADSFRQYLLEDSIPYAPTMGDVGRAIAYENPRMTRREQIETELLYGHPLTWYRYHRYADIVKFVDYLGRRHSQYVRLLHIGRSYEGRPLTMVRVSFAAPVRRRSSRAAKPKKRRPAIVITAGAQAHQWIGPAVATWILQRLVETSNTSDLSPDLETVRSYDWYVLPVANPDGYEYSHEHDRMWSKSRSRPVHQPATAGFGQALLTSAFSWWNTQSTVADQQETCYGVNLERNWPHCWQDGPGSSRSECSLNYAGPVAFSEPETRAVRDFLLTGRRNVRLFVSLQAYGQSLTYPLEHPSDDSGIATRHGAYAFGDVHEMGAVGLEAMRGAGGELTYTVGRSEDACGTATGYARFVAGIRYSYTLRLPDTGTHGFLLPPSNIVSTGRDTFEMIKGMMDYS